MSIRTRSFLRLALAVCLLWLVSALCPCESAGQPDFTFIQVSDLHFPNSATDATLADLVNLGDVVLKAYHVTACRPSFIIETGDLTEFGPKDGAWDAHNRAIKSLCLPNFCALGNHDMTWRALSHDIAEIQSCEYYSWNNYGCHFVVLRSAGIQDPRPILEPQELDWLTRDLAKVGPDMPVFIAFHHPLDSGEYSSPYETDRLVDILRPYNIAVILVGHSHSIVRKTFAGMDMVRGGSTFGPCAPGCMIYSILGGTLRVAYKVRGQAEATIPLLEKPLCSRKKFAPPVEILSPQEDASCKDELAVSVRATGKPSDIRAVTADIDGSRGTDLTTNAAGLFEARMPLVDLRDGVHYVRFSATLLDAPSFSTSVSFRVARDKPKVDWSVQMRAAIKSTPAISDSAVFVGANDGYVRAYDRASGAFLWRFKTGGAVTGEPLLIGDKLYFGSEDTFFYCVAAEGGCQIWKYPVGSPVYSSSIADGKSVYFGCCSGAFYSLDAASGNLNWVNNDATYTIESKPSLAAGRVYYGAWDTYVYCVDTANGKLVWKCMGQGSAEHIAPAYFSPADCGPVVSGGKVFVADRKFRLSIIDVPTGKIDKFLNGVSAVALSSDGKSIYARKLDGKLDKLDQSGNVIWSAACQMDDVPAAPREVEGTVYVSSKHGLVSAIGAGDGKVLWQYQATPQSYVLSAVFAAAGTAFVSATDGSLTAISP